MQNNVLIFVHILYLFPPSLKLDMMIPAPTPSPLSPTKVMKDKTRPR